MNISKGNKCVFINCRKSMRDNPELKLYRIPKDQVRSRQWIINSGNSDLINLSPSQLYNRYVCGLHFEDSAFNASRKRLLKTAVPLPFSNEGELHVQQPTKTYSRENVPRTTSPQPSTSYSLRPSPQRNLDISPASVKWLMDISDMPSPRKTTKRKLPMQDTPRKAKLRKTLVEQQKSLKNKRSIIARLRKNVRTMKARLNCQYFINNMNYVSSSSKALTHMQTIHRPNFPWRKDERQLALRFYYKSPSAYKYMRNSEKIVLPSVSTIRKWIGSSKFQPGFSPRYFQQIKLKVSAMQEEEKYCTVVFDEMKIKQFLEYNKNLDLVEGYEDLGPLGRNNNMGNQALIFMARGLYSPWKLPLAYFISGHSVKKANLQELIKRTIEMALESGLLVKTIICDQGSNNQAACKNLGMTSQKPFFYVGHHKIFSVFDVPHIFKNFRNNFLKEDFIYNGHRISFQDVIKAYRIDKKSGTSRSLLKLTEDHINPGPFKKMSCRLALQIFSHSVSSVIRTCAGTGELNSETAQATANFIAAMNRLFDTLNSISLFSRNPYNRALSEDHPHILETMENAKEWLTSLEKISARGSARPPCFEGLIWSINAIMGLFTSQKEIGFDYLYTQRLNQDVIENLFSSYRQRGGFNKNPTARTLRTTFRFNAITNLLKSSDKSNCKEDEDKHLIAAYESETSMEIKVMLQENIAVSSSSPSTGSSSSSPSIPTEEFEQHVSLEDCANFYFSGYLAKKCIDKFSCDICKNNLLKTTDLTDERELLILYRTYESSSSTPSSLKTPSEKLNSFVENSLNALRKVVAKKPERKGLRAHILKIIKRKFFSLIEISGCELHLEFLAQHLINCKLFKEFKWRSLDAKEPQTKYSTASQKLSILKNI